MASATKIVVNKFLKKTTMCKMLFECSFRVIYDR